jgi:hypothetical protein
MMFEADGVDEDFVGGLDGGDFVVFLGFVFAG